MRRSKSPLYNVRAFERRTYYQHLRELAGASTFEQVCELRDVYWQAGEDANALIEGNELEPGEEDDVEIHGLPQSPPPGGRTPEADPSAFLSRRLSQRARRASRSARRERAASARS